MEEINSNFIHEIIDSNLADNPELKIHTPYDSGILFLCIDTKQKHVDMFTKIQNKMFIQALFVITRSIIHLCYLRLCFFDSRGFNIFQTKIILSITQAR